MMQFFRLICRHVDVQSLIHELSDREEAWKFDTSRQDRIAFQRHTESIPLRGRSPRTDLGPNDDQESCDSPIARDFPRAMGLLHQFANLAGASLSRAMIVRLKGGGEVASHRDLGGYYFIRDRYHLVLNSPSGSILRSGPEQVRMHPGELWWFDNKQFHSAINTSDEWRVHCIFDLLPYTRAGLAVNPLPPVNWTEDGGPGSSFQGRENANSNVRRSDIIAAEAALMPKPQTIT